VLEVSDRVCAMFLGRIAAEVPAVGTTREQLVELITSGASSSLGVTEVAG
jgi:D-xylose transport system ATP-binding protein